MDQSGNNQLLLRASQSGPPGYNGYNGQHAAADRMRELLARTVQDHIVEERTTATGSGRSSPRSRSSPPAWRKRSPRASRRPAPTSWRGSRRLKTVLTLAEALLRPATRRLGPAHSHSMVPGGLLVMSSATRLTSRTSLVIRVEILASTS